MLIITVETTAANVNVLLDGPQQCKEFLTRAYRHGNQRAGASTRAIVDEIHATSETDSRSATLRVDGTLRSPVDGVLRSRVESLLHGCVRRVVLDLSGVSDIDAAGVGELIHLFNTAAAAGGVVEIAHATPHVHHVLDVVGYSGCSARGAETIVRPRTIAGRPASGRGDDRMR